VKAPSPAGAETAAAAAGYEFTSDDEQQVCVYLEPRDQTCVSEQCSRADLHGMFAKQTETLQTVLIRATTLHNLKTPLETRAG
jgi:hypothetical protein